jgi:hypothetical protein
MTTRRWWPGSQRAHPVHSLEPADRCGFHMQRETDVARPPGAATDSAASPELEFLVSSRSSALVHRQLDWREGKATVHENGLSYLLHL